MNVRHLRCDFVTPLLRQLPVSDSRELGRCTKYSIAGHCVASMSSSYSKFRRSAQDPSHPPAGMDAFRISPGGSTFRPRRHGTETVQRRPIAECKSRVRSCEARSNRRVGMKRILTSYITIAKV